MGVGKPMKKSSLLRGRDPHERQTLAYRGEVPGRVWHDAEKDKETHSKNKQAMLGPWVFWGWQSLSFNPAQIVQFHAEGTG